MQPAPSTQFPDGLLAAALLLSRKPRHGVPSRNPAPHQPIDKRNCTAALGLEASLRLNAIGPTEHNGSYDATNPQSFNRYAYVLNNPLSLTDPSGLDWNYNPTDGCFDWGYTYTSPDGTEGTGTIDGCGYDAGVYYGGGFYGNPNSGGPGGGVAGATLPANFGPPHLAILSSAPGSCNFPGCFRYYGNYGGPGWTGGHYAPEEWETFGDPFTPGIPPGLAPPIDQEDALYMNHDRAYSQARLSTYDKMALQSIADLTLVEGLNALPFSATPSWNSYYHALGALIYFPIQGSVKGAVSLFNSESQYCAENWAACD